MKRMRYKLGLACPVLALALLCGGLSWAQEPPRDFEQRIRKHFSNMLRTELALSDEQSERVLPMMTELESFKREVSRDRRETVRRLRDGMEGGASDAELRSLLDDLDRAEDDQRIAEREALEKIDAELTARQSVKLRFFVQQFRREVSDRLRRGHGDRSQYRRMGEGPRRPGR